MKKQKRSSWRRSISIKVPDGESVKDVSITGDGWVVFEKIPPATYFIKEETDDDGNAVIEDNGGTSGNNADKRKCKPVHKMYKIVLDPKGLLTVYAPVGTDENVDWSSASGVMEAVQNTVKINDESIRIYKILNESSIKRKVILKKVKEEGENQKPLEGATFRIFRADLSEITDGRGVYTSGKTGVYYIGKLPVGKYYLVETTPSQKLFTLKITTGDMKMKLDADTDNNNEDLLTMLLSRPTVSTNNG